jgi:hypothetical protein
MEKDCSTDRKVTMKANADAMHRNQKMDLAY